MKIMKVNLAPTNRSTEATHYPRGNF